MNAQLQRIADVIMSDANDPKCRECSLPLQIELIEVKGDIIGTGFCPVHMIHCPVCGATCQGAGGHYRCPNCGWSTG